MSLDPTVWQVRGELCAAFLRTVSDPTKAARVEGLSRPSDRLCEPDAAPVATKASAPSQP